MSGYFNPRPPRGGRPLLCVGEYGHQYFNPRPPRGGRLPSEYPGSGANDISIHAPREGGRRGAGRGGAGLRRISIHAPREGGRPIARRDKQIEDIFQSTPPARGGDIDAPHVDDRQVQFQSTPPARGGDSKDAQFYLRIFDKQVELLRFLGIIRGGCLRNPEKDRRFLGKSLANLPEISGHLDFAGA